ncbi:MAG: hypothetical protein A3I87_00385 [Candidatus Staskawiczbacteria bacterium RIFCSPLOWO2_02_FULL_39_8]|nr:MAG: hypothetical protein A3I87_00385 [Candidatus Staskawiczbacteria bacterium RIFCSPLOWO2_02_FULL_39_8]
MQREQKELEETRESLDMERDSKGEARGMGQDSAHLESDEIVKKLLADAEQKGEKGIESALGAAQKMKDPYILDRLRDMLAEKIQKNKFGKKK